MLNIPPKLDKTTALQSYQVIRFLGIITISIAMAKLSVPQSQIGQYELLLFLTNLFATFWVTGMIQALLPLYTKFQHGTAKSSVLFNAFIMVAGLSVLSGGIALLAKSLFFSTEGSTGLPFYHLAALYLMLSTPTLLIEYIYLLQDKPRQMVLYGALTHTLQVILVVGPLFFAVNVEYSVYGLIAISLIRMVWLITLICRSSLLTVNKQFLKEHARQGFPLALKYLIGSSGAYIDQAIVTAHFDSSTFAIYRFGAREIPLIALMTSGLSTSLLGDFGNPLRLRATLGELRQKSLRLMHLLFPLAILTILLSKPLFPVVFSPDFTESAGILMIYALIVISRSLYPQTVTVGLQRNAVALLASVGEMVLNIALSLLLIPLGIEGVALATVTVYLAEKVFLAHYNRKKLGIALGEYTPLGPLGLYSTATIAAYCVARFAL